MSQATVRAAAMQGWDGLLNASGIAPEPCAIGGAMGGANMPLSESPGT